ncbi:MAG: methionyl-tRNA formyltransferase [Treponema sp.]|jgi:methionyl-tRNA formyltransferase|nr:methionyl-tRNA formyltransferase [Treponema sp.]
MRILYAASPAIAVPVLESLVREPEGFWELAGLLTNPDASRGRRGGPVPSEAAAAAAGFLTQDLILKPEKLDAAAREAVMSLRPDLLVSFAYGRIFGPKFLALFPLGGINIHPSLLPKYRGPTPIPAAILGRDRETGITIQRLAAAMDAGDILLQERFPLSGRETTEDLSETAARRAPVLLRQVLAGLVRGDIQGRPQDNQEASYCSLISKEDGRIDWNRSAADIDAQIRAYTPWPLSWTTQGDRLLTILEAQPCEKTGLPAPVPPVSIPVLPGSVLGVDKNRGILVQTGEGVLGITRLQYRTKKALQWQVFLNGAKDFTGSRLL